MANEINISLGQTGQNVTARLLLAGVLDPNTIVCSEVSGVGGQYVGNMPAVAAGFYQVLFYVDTTLRGGGQIEWDGAAEVLVASRLASSGYTVPPTVAQTRQEMDANSTRLAHLNADTPTNFAALAITGGGLVDVNDKTNFALSAAEHVNVATDVQAGLLAQGYTTIRAGYLDNINLSGPAAAKTDIDNLNTSASRRTLPQVLPAFERPDSGTTLYTIELRTFDGDGALKNADTTPTLTAIGSVSGSLSANLSAATNPATGVYRWTYTVASNAAQEQIRFDSSATITDAVSGTATFPMSSYSQIVDFVSATWTSANATQLADLHSALGSRPYFVMTTDAAGSAVADVQAGLTAQGYTSARAAFLDALNGIVAAVQAGLATSAGLTALQSHGDSAWATAVVSGLLTSSAFTTALTALQSHGDTAWATAVLSSLLTSSAFNTGISNLQTHGDSNWATAVVSALLTTAAFNAALPSLASQAGLDALDSEVADVQTDTTAILGSLTGLSAGPTIYVRSQVDDLGNVVIYRQKQQTISWNSSTVADLLAAGTTVMLEFGEEYSFPTVITGVSGAWVITATLTVLNTTIGLGPYDGELAVYISSVEQPALAEFKVLVKANR